LFRNFVGFAKGRNFSPRPAENENGGRLSHGDSGLCVLLKILLAVGLALGAVILWAPGPNARGRALVSDALRRDSTVAAFAQQSSLEAETSLRRASLSGIQSRLFIQLRSLRSFDRPMRVSRKSRLNFLLFRRTKHA
jgi:hypothetical protein